MSSGSAVPNVTNTGSSSTPIDGDGGPASEGDPASIAGDGPSRIGKYEVVKLLGKGGTGAVYQAYDPLLEREVALEMLPPAIAEDPELKRRFERDARAVERLRHPNVVTLFDLGYHTDGSPYVVTELFRGRDLGDILRHGLPLSLERRVSIVLQVLDGLGHAHQLGIVHREIQPANAFVTEDGSVKIRGFGFARCVSANYMSPEQVRGDRVDGRSDLFSVGTLLCELLAGRRPFDADTSVATLFRIANGEPDLDLPPGPEYAGFEPVLRRALARDPDERYATGAEFAAALRSLADPDSTSTRCPGPSPARRRADPAELFRLLREIHVGGQSGQLQFTVASQEKSLRILRGQIVYGASDAAGEHLGSSLVERGLLSHADLERALQVALAERKRLGSVLVERGLVDRARLQEAIGRHAQNILFSALDGVDVCFAFEELSEVLVETDLVCPISTGQAILDATRRLADPDLVRSVLGDTARVLRLSTNPLLRTQKITLTPADAFVLSRIDGTLSARDVVGLIPLPAGDTERSLFGLLCTGIVEYGATPTPTTPMPTPIAQPTRMAPAPPEPDIPATARIDPKLEPAYVLAVARKLYGSEKYWDAIQQLEPLVERVEEPIRAEASLLLAQAYLKNPLWKRQAEGSLQSVLATNPDHVPALLLLAQIYAEGRLLNRARGLYRKVLELSPDHPEASQGLAAVEPPAVEAPMATPSAGLLRRLLRVR